MTKNNRKFLWIEVLAWGNSNYSFNMSSYNAL